MNRNKTGLLIVLMFVLALGAGVVAGKLATRPPAPVVVPVGSALSDELQLSPAQREQMRGIWEAVRDTAQSCARDASAAQQHEQEELIKMLTPDQQARFDRLQAQTRARVDVLEARRKSAFRDAVERTKQLLNPDQRRVYEQILRTRVGADV